MRYLEKNSAGKSNFLSGMKFFYDLVAKSDNYTGSLSKEIIEPHTHWGNSSMPIELELTFLLDGVKHQYGFVLSPDADILEEWLYIYPNKRAQMLFTRNSHEFNFGRSLKGSPSSVLRKDDMQYKALFLGHASRYVPQLKTIHAYIKKLFCFVDEDNKREAIRGLLHNETLRQALTCFLYASDFELSNVEIQDITPHYPKGVGAAQTDLNLKLVKSTELAFRDSVHNKLILWSDLPIGAKEAIATFCLLHQEFNRQNPRFIVIDNYGEGLHPAVCDAILDLVHDSEFNITGSQVLLATQQVNVMNWLDRGQVWFVEFIRPDISANEKRRSILTPLSDYEKRKGEWLSMGYLVGRYGAVPYIMTYDMAHSANIHSNAVEQP